MNETELRKEIEKAEKKYQVLSDEDNYGALGFARGKLQGYQEGKSETIGKVMKEITREFNKQRKITWDAEEEHSSNPIHQSDFIAWEKELKKNLEKIK